MNFLAHLYLSQQPEELMVGNFIGDFVKGRAFEDFPHLVQQGIILHREIDAFTDDNSFVKESKRRLVPKYRHYSAVIVDMFYDHFLAASWRDYHSEELEAFASKIYVKLQNHWDLLPERAQFMLPYMVKHNWLVSYEAISGIDKALSGLSRRSRFTSYMEHASKDLENDYEAYDTEFKAFFPQIIEHINNWKKDNLTL